MKRDYQTVKKKHFADYLLKRYWAHKGFQLLIPCMGLFWSVFMGKGEYWWLLFPVWVLFFLHFTNLSKEKKKIKFYKELEVFIENLQMFYGYYGDMEEAVFEAMVNSRNAGYDFGKKMDRFLKNRLKEGEKEECDQREQLLLEIGRCGMDMEVNQIHVQESLRRLKEELREEIFRLEETGIQYQGLAGLCLIPLLSIPLLKSWAISYLEELKNYYEGPAGLWASFSVLFLTVLIFFLLYQLRFEPTDFRIPIIRKAFAKYREERELTGEILRLHNWILLQQHNKESNVETLLEGFCCLTGGLKEKVERLYYDYMEKGSDGIARAREEELYIPYVRILEGLLLCDKVSVKTAFFNLETERAYYLEKLRTENRRKIQEKAALGRVLAFLPLYSVCALLLIIPFVVEGLGQLQTYTDSFSSLFYP